MHATLNNTQEQAIARIVAAAMKGLNNPNGPIINTASDRQSSMAKIAAKEQLLSRWLRTEGGLMKIAANLGNPVRNQLDYKGIGRKFVIVEQIPDGIPIYYDKDLPKVPCTKIGADGATRFVEMKGIRVYLDAFAIAGRPKIPYDQLYTLKYKPIARTKDRLIEGMELQEDLLWFGLFESNSEVANTKVVSTGDLFKPDLAKVFARVEDHRLVVRNVLMSAYGTAGIRSWTFEHMDQLGMQEVRETGYLGAMWGANFWVSDQIPKGTLYATCDPKFLAWEPIRKDVEVIPANDPDNLWLGFTGYLYAAMNFFNPLGIAKLEFQI
jgi:hypothetical protein